MHHTFTRVQGIIKISMYGAQMTSHNHITKISKIENIYSKNMSLWFSIKVSQNRSQNATKIPKGAMFGLSSMLCHCYTILNVKERVVKKSVTEHATIPI